MTGYVHASVPARASASRWARRRPVGTINADVSTCIAGWLDARADMDAMSMTVIREPSAQPRTYQLRRPAAAIGHARLHRAHQLRHTEDCPEMTRPPQAHHRFEARPPWFTTTFFRARTSRPTGPAGPVRQVPALVTRSCTNSSTPSSSSHRCVLRSRPARRTADIVRSSSHRRLRSGEPSRHTVFLAYRDCGSACR